MSNNFLKLNQDIIEAEKLLLYKGFEKLDDTIYNPEQPEPLILIINQKDKTFWTTDSLGILDLERIINLSKKQKIKQTNIQFLNNL